MSEKHQVTNKWENYERYYHYAPLIHFQNIVHKDKFIKPGESKVSEKFLFLKFKTLKMAVNEGSTLVSFYLVNFKTFNRRSSADFSILIQKLHIDTRDKMKELLNYIFKIL